MIELHPDCLFFQTDGGESIPCSAELVAFELIGDATNLLDPELVRNAARAVLHYFKMERGKSCVSLREFVEALARVLRGFGLTVKSSEAAGTPRHVTESDLRHLACESGKGFELAFFPRLRDELRQQLSRSPDVLRFTGLKGCVKQLAGTRRWTGGCQQLNDQIVEYLRHCLGSETSAAGCSIVVS